MSGRADLPIDLERFRRFCHSPGPGERPMAAPVLAALGKAGHAAPARLDKEAERRAALA